VGQRARPRKSVIEEISAGWDEARQRQLVKTSARRGERVDTIVTPRLVAKHRRRG
jgi:hypothetical protein